MHQAPSPLEKPLYTKEHKNRPRVLALPQNFLLLQKEPASPSGTRGGDGLETGFRAGFSGI